MQKPFAAEAEQAYEIGAEEDTADKTMLTLAKIVAPWSDTVRVTATEILFDVLTGSNDAPLKKALLATGKCQDVGMSLDNAMAQPYMMLTHAFTPFSRTTGMPSAMVPSSLSTAKTRFRVS